MIETAQLHVNGSVLTIEIVNSDLHRGRVMAYGADANGNQVYRFTKRKDGSYRLKGRKDGILVRKVVA